MFIEITYRAWVSITYRNVSDPKGVTPLKGLTLAQMMTYPNMHRQSNLSWLYTPASLRTTGLCAVRT